MIKMRRCNTDVYYSLTYRLHSDFTNCLSPLHPHSSVGKESACSAGDPGSVPGSGGCPGEGIGYPLQPSQAALAAQLVKNPPSMRATWVRPLVWEDPPEKGKATHSSILAWRILRTVEPTVSQRVGHHWATFTSPLPPPGGEVTAETRKGKDVSPNPNSIPLSPAPGPRRYLNQPCFPAGPGVRLSVGFHVCCLLYCVHNLPRSARRLSFVENAG